MNRITVIIFGVILSLSLLTQALPDKTFSDLENRYLQTMPKLTWDNLMSGRFTSSFESYIQDHFVLRDEWIKEKVNLEQLVGKEETKNVYFGPDGWYFEVEQSINEKTLKSNIGYLSSFRAWLEENQINTTFFPIYSSYMYYEDLLPENHLNINQKDILEQIQTEISVIDSYQNIKDQKDEHIYFKTDHHWTQLGAYYAYETLADQKGWDIMPLSSYQAKTADKAFYGTLYSKAPRRQQVGDVFTYYVDPKYDYTLRIPEVNSVSDSLYNLDSLEKKDMYTTFLGGNNGVVIIERNEKPQSVQTKEQDNPNQEETTLVMFKDSYSHALAPFVAQHYDKVVLIDMRYFTGSVRDFVTELNPTDVIFAYNVSWFANDANLVKWKS